VNNLCIIWSGLKLKYLLTFMLTPPYKACEMVCIIVYNNIPFCLIVFNFLGQGDALSNSHLSLSVSGTNLGIDIWLLYPIIFFFFDVFVVIDAGVFSLNLSFILCVLLPATCQCVKCS
ncbi:hypothetical protein ACJX0J_007888, partial [Zea mays]